MKATKILMFMALYTVALSSCSRDDDTITTDPVIGNWTLVSMNGTALDACRQKTEARFNADGSYQLQPLSIKS